MTIRMLAAGCAAVAMMAAAGSASAQSKFSLEIGGDAWTTAGWVDQSNDVDQRAVEFINRFRLMITPTAKADNGLEYGARVRLRANRGTAQADTDRAFVFMQGKFGRIEAGQVDGPNGQYYVTHPTDAGTGGVDGDFSYFMPYTTVQTNFGWNTVSGDAGPFGSATSTKINYFTPRFFGTDDETGLMGMVSYAPNVEELATGQNTTVDRNNRTLLAAGSAAPEFNGNGNDTFEIGLRYDGKYANDLTLGAGLFYIGGSKKDVAVTGGATTRYENLSAWQTGLQLGYKGFKVGGGFLWAGDSAYQKNSGAEDQFAWTLGAQYEFDKFIVGANYMKAEDAGTLATAGARKQNVFAVGATYLVAPGLDVALEYIHNEINNETGIADIDGDAVLLRTQVKF